MIDVMKYANYYIEVDNINTKYFIRLLDYQRVHAPISYKNILTNLAEQGYYAVYNMPGHRGTHHFPTENECMLWEDWLLDMREDG